jgi:hypothetical protein
MKKLYKLRVEWAMSAIVEIEADSLAAAVNIAKDAPLPDDGFYVEDSFRVESVDDGKVEPNWDPHVMAFVTKDAYSADRYNSWPAVCMRLNQRGFTAREAEAILRSKWMRWAGDARPKSGKPTSTDLLNFLDSSKIVPGDSAVTELLSYYKDECFKYENS